LTPTPLELVQAFIRDRLEKVPKLRMSAAEREGRLSELKLLQFIAEPEEAARRSAAETKRVCDEVDELLGSLKHE
jgi:hypothetical protein